MIRLWLGLVVWAALAAPCGAAPCGGTRHAVVIGINQYGHGVQPLRGARADAERVAKALSAQGYQVTTLLDEAATRDRLRLELGHTLTQSKPEDQVLIYFAGHGETLGKARPMGYLLPVDARADRIAVTGLSMSELVAWMETYPARQRLLIADACYSGLALPSTRSIRPDEPQVSQCPPVDLPVTAAIVAGRAGDLAHESGAGGLFTQTLLKVLAGQTNADPNQDGWISHSALGGYLSEVVRDEVKTRYGRAQVPQVASLGDGQFMLAARDPSAPAAPPPATAATSVAVGPKTRAIAPPAAPPKPTGPAPRVAVLADVGTGPATKRLTADLEGDLLAQGLRPIDPAQSRAMRSVTDAGKVLESGLSALTVPLDADYLLVAVGEAQPLPDQFGGGAFRAFGAVRLKLITVATGEVVAAGRHEGATQHFTQASAQHRAVEQAAKAALAQALAQRAARPTHALSLVLEGCDPVARCQAALDRLQTLPDVARVDLIQLSPTASKAEVHLVGGRGPALMKRLSLVPGLTPAAVTQDTVRARLQPAKGR